MVLANNVGPCELRPVSPPTRGENSAPLIMGGGEHEGTMMVLHIALNYVTVDYLRAASYTSTVLAAAAAINRPAIGNIDMSP